MNPVEKNENLNNIENPENKLSEYLNFSEILEYCFEKIRNLSEEKKEEACNLCNNVLLDECAKKGIDFSKAFNTCENPIGKIS